MCMLSMRILLLRVCSAYTYCYYVYAQYKHSNKSKMREIYANAEHTRSNIMLKLSIRVVTVPDPGGPSISGPIQSIKMYSCIQICLVKGISVV